MDPLQFAQALESMHATGHVAQALQMVAAAARAVHAGTRHVDVGPHTPTHVVQWACAKLGLRLRAGRMSNSDSRLRSIVAYMVWFLTDASNPELAKHLGWHCHSSPVRAMDLVDKAPELAAQAKTLITDYKRQFPR